MMTALMQCACEKAGVDGWMDGWMDGRRRGRTDVWVEVMHVGGDVVPHHVLLPPHETETDTEQQTLSAAESC